MRPIKFRAIRYTDGVLEKIYDVTGIDYDEDFDVYNARLKNNEWIINVIPLQYTGLKDKNGVEIYEGDVVNITQYFGGHPYGETKHIVKRSKYNNNLVADSESGDWRTPEVSMTFRSSDDYEVIGNVYENPELLEEI